MRAKARTAIKTDKEHLGSNASPNLPLELQESKYGTSFEKLMARIKKTNMSI